MVVARPIAPDVLWAELVPYGDRSSENRRFDGSVVVVDANPFTIGRKDTSFLTSNPAVSELHCSLSYSLFEGRSGDDESDYEVVLSDSSRNGVRVNGKKIGKGNTCVVQDGDVLQIVYANLQNQHLSMVYMLHCKIKQALTAVTRDIRSDYYLDDQIGKGSFGVVKKGTAKKDGNQVAIKMIILKKVELAGGGENVFQPLSQDVPRGTEERKEQALQRERQMREIDILKRLTHRNIVQILGVYLNDTECYIVMELATGGDLYHYIKKHGMLPENDAKLVFGQLLSAVEYLHSNGIAHRDIKPENILLSREEDLSSVKLTDFGMAKNFGTECKLETTCGTPMYAAPEVINRRWDHEAIGEYQRAKQSGKQFVKPPAPLPYTPAVDIWSSAVVLWVMLTARPPFPRKKVGAKTTTRMDYAAGLNFAVPPMPRVPQSLRDLIRVMMREEPSQRATIDDIYANPWMSGVERGPSSIPHVGTEAACGSTSSAEQPPLAKRPRVGDA